LIEVQTDKAHYQDTLQISL